MTCSRYLFLRCCVDVVRTWLAIDVVLKYQHFGSFDYSLIDCAKRSLEVLRRLHLLLQEIGRLLRQASDPTWNSYETARCISMALDWPFEDSRMICSANCFPSLMQHRQTAPLSQQYPVIAPFYPMKLQDPFQLCRFGFVESQQIYWSCSPWHPEELFVVKYLASCHLSNRHFGSSLCCFHGPFWCCVCIRDHRESDLLIVYL